jgi:sarcosine oxidase subunit beta
MRYEIVIFGAGVIGSSIAFHLASRGVRDILVIDRGADFGNGSTAKATGGFRAQFDNETEVRLSLLSREKLRSFVEETGVDSGYRPHGYLFLGRTNAELDFLRKAQAVQHACGLHEARMLSATEALQLNPAIGDPSIIGAAFCPTDGFLRPMNILRGYAEAAQRLGVRFEFAVELLELRDAVARTSKGDLHAQLFVNAMGAWAGSPVVPMRRNVAATISTSVLPESMPMTIFVGDGFHLRVRDGRVLLLMPAAHDAPLEALSAGAMLAACAALQDGPFNLWLVHEPGVHWYVEFVPRTAIPAGVEMALGIGVSIVDPHASAEAARARLAAQLGMQS